MNRNRLYILLSIACIAGYSWLYLGLTGHNSMEVCLIKRTTGLPGPSCGSTRSVISITEGKFDKALALNPLGYVVAAIMLILPPWLIFDLTKKRDSLYRSYQRIETLLRKPQYAVPLTLLVIANWIWNIHKGL